MEDRCVQCDKSLLLEYKKTQCETQLFCRNCLNAKSGKDEFGCRLPYDAPENWTEEGLSWNAWDNKDIEEWLYFYSKP